MSGGIATECRAAANELLQADTWGRAELATWLAGPYRHAARFSNDALEEEATPLSGTHHRRLSTAPAPSETQVKNLVDQAQKAVLQMLELASMQPDGFEALTQMCFQAGFVKSRTMDDGTTRIVPVDRARMTLVDRVVSLLIAARAEPSKRRESGTRAARPDPRRE